MRNSYSFGWFWLLAFIAISGRSEITFNKDLAPIIFERCARCHQQGQAVPFPLETYDEVKAHAKKIVEATGARRMPPWLPAGEFGEFIGDRRLPGTQIQLFRQWLDAGMPEGPVSALTAAPKKREEWQLGKPDVIVQMPEKFTLSAEGKDVYRNFVIPVPIDRPRYVRAVEFNPYNARIVHHAFIKVDSSGQVHRLEGKDGKPGFPGMNALESVKMPSGYFLSYQPGKMPAAEPPGFGWTLEPGQELVLQTHLRPTGRREELQARIGLYFTDIPPTNTTMTFSLSSLTIDLPAGTSNNLVEDSFTMPVESDLLAVLPHTHYLGKRLEALAQFPNGRTQELLLIPDWDFNWQGEYRYARPIHLPAGTRLRMQYVFDNSADNPANPNKPAKEVFCGSQSTDEMAEFWVQVLVNGPEDAQRLAEAYNQKNLRMFAGYSEFRLQRNPKDAHAHTELGFTQWSQGRLAEAMASLQAATNEDATYDQPHYYMGVIFRTKHDLRSARAELEKAIELNPDNARAHGNLAFVFIELDKLERAERSMRTAANLDPTDALIKEGLEQIVQLRARLKSTAN